ncbi:MAG: hypothetical protein ACRC6V_13360 [Bacteroidales bacterium]
MTNDMRTFLRTMHDDIRERSKTPEGVYSISQEDREWFDMLRPYCECDDQTLWNSITSNVAHIFCQQFDNVCLEFLEVVARCKEELEDEDFEVLM